MPLLLRLHFFPHLYYYITQSHDTHVDNPDYHSTETRKTDSQDMIA